MSPLSSGLLAAVGVLVGSALTRTGLHRICADLARLLSVDGVAVTVTTAPWAADGSGFRVVVGASDPVAWSLEMAQLTAGVGPCTEATPTGSAVAVDDLTAELDRWPGLGEQLAGIRVGAVTAVALRAGQTTIGSLDAYRVDSHPWTPGEVADITEAARVLAFGLAAAPVGTGDLDHPGLLEATQAGVAQATGMVMAALDVSAADAVSRLRATAFAEGRPITAVAEDVLTHQLSPILP